LILCYGPLDRDPRVIRQILALNSAYQITAAGYTNPLVDNINFFQLTPYFRPWLKKIAKLFNLISGNHDRNYWHQTRVQELIKLSSENYELIIANDLDALPLAIELAKRTNAKVIFDAHEYYPDSGHTNGLRFWLLNREIIYQCNKYLYQSDVVTTVSSGLKEAYEQNFHIKPTIIKNTPKLKNLKPSTVGTEIHLVHHGIAAPIREIEKMVRMAELLDSRYFIHFYLVDRSNGKYFNKIKKISNSERVIFHDPVPTANIPDEINKYDIGLFLLPPNNFNYRHALPNKFFEFIQARLAIAIGPSLEMKHYVDKYSLGVCSDSFSPFDLAHELNILSSNKIRQFKLNVDKAALELNFEVESGILKTIVSNTFNKTKINENSISS